MPAYNEERNLPHVLENLRRECPDHDVLVVDDGSRDGTYAAARRAGVPAVRLPVNLGIGGAVQTGLKYAVMRGHDVAIQVDGDGQHDPAEVKKLVNIIREGGCDMVIGSRYLEKTAYRTPVTRRIGMICFSLFTSLVVRRKITDTTSGFRALNRPALEYLSRFYPVDFPDAEVLVMAHRRGYRMREVPVRMNARLHGRSSTTTLKSLYYPFKAGLAILALLLQGREKDE